MSSFPSQISVVQLFKFSRNVILFQRYAYIIQETFNVMLITNLYLNYLNSLTFSWPVGSLAQSLEANK